MSGPAVSFPPEWGDQAEDGDAAWWGLTEYDTLSLESAEVGLISTMLRQACPTARLSVVRRVRNRQLWKNYRECRDDIKRHNDGDANEQLLFHGTGATRADDVLKDPGGLDPRHSEGGGFYGRGVYLSERPDYQIGGRYAHFVSGSGQRRAELLVVKAALGAQQDFGTRVDADTRKMAMPGVRSEEPILQRFDSVRAGPHRPHVAGAGESGLNASFVHVLYEKRQLYVAYAIEVQLGLNGESRPAVAAAPAAVPTAKPAPPRTAKPAPTAKRQKTTPDDILNGRFRDQIGEEIYFKVKKTVKLENLFNTYAQQNQGVSVTWLRFLFDGQRIRSDQTCEDINFEDGDQFDVVVVDSLNIMLRDQTGEKTFFKVKKTTKLDKVFNAYSQRKGVNATSLRFLFDGQRVRGDQTPQDIDMDDGDQLDCMLEQQGGR